LKPQAEVRGKGLEQNVNRNDYGDIYDTVVTLLFLGNVVELN